MQDFKIALVQQDSRVGQKSRNLASALEWTRRAARKGARLICFPEMNITGHAGHKDMLTEAEPVPGGQSVDALAGLAAELDVFISAAMVERHRGVHYNTQFIVGPGGYVGKQRKVHLSRDEYFYFRGGTRLPVFDLGFARVGMIICYDNHFPEISRCLAVEGAEVLLAPHAWRIGPWPRSAAGRRKIVREQKEHYKMVHRCRAYDNGVYVALVNSVGRAAAGIKGVEANHAGSCVVCDPRGKVIAESRSRDIREEMVVVPLRARAVAERRSAIGFTLQTRRPEVFAELTRFTE